MIGEVGEPAAGMDEYGVILRDGSGRPLYFDVSDAYVGGLFCYKVPEGLFLTTPKMDVYGGPRRPDPSPTVGKHRFVGNLGHTTEPDTGGLIYMRARWMDPVTGRFISEDPKANGVNWYVYCGDNPVNLVDPDGKKAYNLWVMTFATIAVVTFFLQLAADTVKQNIDCMQNLKQTTTLALTGTVVAAIAGEDLGTQWLANRLPSRIGWEQGLCTAGAWSYAIGVVIFSAIRAGQVLYQMFLNGDLKLR